MACCGGVGRTARRTIAVEARARSRVVKLQECFWSGGVQPLGGRASAGGRECEHYLAQVDGSGRTRGGLRG